MIQMDVSAHICVQLALAVHAHEPIDGLAANRDEAHRDGEQLEHTCND